MFHKEGFKILTVTSIIIVIGILLADYFIASPWLQKTIQILLIFLYVIVLQFFRNPKRNTVLNDNHVIAPVDGKVVVIEEVFEPEFFKDKRLQVSIFMSPINVHVTRYAMSGTVKYSKSINGE
jgi:phosphatidylserine decarboxylase